MELATAVIVTIMMLIAVTERHLTAACQCQSPDHPQEMFCSSDYVIIGRIVERIEEFDDDQEFPEFPINIHIEDPPVPMTGTDDPPQESVIFGGGWPPLRKVQAPEEPMYLPPLMVNDGPHLYPGFLERRGTLKYIVQVEKVFRGEEEVLKNNKVVIQTDLSGSLCGLTNLEVEERYLISGSVVDGQMSVHLCDWVQSASSLTKMQRRGLRHFYIKYCDACQIETGTFYFPSSSQGRTVCSYNSQLYSGTDCEAKFSSCVQRPNGSCGWYKGKDYKMCRKTAGLKWNGHL